jgi:hypothetical protein
MRAKDPACPLNSMRSPTIVLTTFLSDTLQPLRYTERKKIRGWGSFVATADGDEIPGPGPGPGLACLDGSHGWHPAARFLLLPWAS